MNTMPASAEFISSGSYEVTRIGRQSVLSRHTVLPWEDEGEYQAVLAALVTEHAPRGPIEEHLVDELAGIIWRKRRLRMAEAAVYRRELRQHATSYDGPGHIAGAALLPLTGEAHCKADIPQAIASTPAETARDLRDIRRDQRMTRQALDILEAGGPVAYEGALAALGDDARAYWQDCLSEPPKDGLTYEPTPDALKAWIGHHWKDWYKRPTAELKHRDAIRDQALGVAYATESLDVVARYEVHLDRKLERTLAMLIRLWELRHTTMPA